MRKAVALLAVVALVPTLAACESSQDKNARLAKIAEKEIKPAATGLVLGQPDKRIEIVGKEVISGSSGTAVVVTLKNTSAQNVRDLPIGLRAFGPRGGDPSYRNPGAG